MIENNGIQIPAKNVCVRNMNNKNAWIAIISTNTDIYQNDIIRAYEKH